MSSRSVRRIHHASRDDIGDLITRRPLPNPRLEQIDPFLFLNHHGPQTYGPGNQGLPFGPHPHRGFETVTFILEGSLAHRDSGGHDSVIHSGGVQWMRAGSGVVHSEVSPPEFLRSGGPLEIIQLWVNLPSTEKMTAPRYLGLQTEDIPRIELDDGRITVRLISGSWDDCEGPFSTTTDIHLSTIRLREGASLPMEIASDRSVLLYVVRGEAVIDDVTLATFTLAELESAGSHFELRAEDEALILLGHAPPIGEPVAAHGPFVMNTVEEIMDAIRDYQAGRFQ